MLSYDDLMEMADRIAYRVVRAGHTEVSTADLRILAHAVMARNRCCAPATAVEGGVTCILHDGHDGFHQFPPIGER